MKVLYQILKKFSVSAVVCALLVPALTQPSPAADYESITIPAPLGYLSVSPGAINDSVSLGAINDNCEVVGRLSTQICYLPKMSCPILKSNLFLYSGNKLLELLPSQWSPGTSGINTRGDVVFNMWGGINYHNRAFIYRTGSYLELMPPGWVSVSNAVGINKNGAVAGVGSGSNYITKGFIYKEGEYTELLPPGGRVVEIYGMNDNEDIIGMGLESKKFLYSKGKYVELQVPEEDPFGVFPQFLNNRGDVIVGHSQSHQNYLYSKGTYTKILPPGWNRTYVRGINNNGTVIGGGSEAGLGFIYNEGKYTILSGEPSAINDRGDVIGKGGLFIYNVESGTYTALSLANWKITAGGKTPSILSINNSAILYGINHPFGILSPRNPIFIFPAYTAYIAVQKENDADSDGVPNSLDWCFNSATAPTIFAGFCDTGVANQVLENGCTMQDRINGCVSRGFNGWASLQRPCLSLLLNSWIIRGLITQDEKQLIQNCAEQAQTPE